MIALNILRFGFVYERLLRRNNGAARINANAPNPASHPPPLELTLLVPFTVTLIVVVAVRVPLVPVTVTVYEPASNGSIVSVFPLTSKSSPSSEPDVTSAVYVTVAPNKFALSVTV